MAFCAIFINESAGWQNNVWPSRLWRRFREKYGEPDTITNFFFGSHSRPSSRIQGLENEIALNYRK